MCSLYWNYSQLFHECDITCFATGFVFLLQMIPEIQLQSWAKYSVKMMREHCKVTTRKAVIKPRKLFDFISPVFFSSALLLLIGCLSVVFYAKGLQLRGMIIMGAIVVYNVYAAYSVYSCIYGKKLNPHQVYEDRIKEITMQVKKYFLLSMVISSVIGVIGILRIFQLEYLEASIISACIQLMIYAITWRGLKKLNMDEMDFSPYRIQN